MNKYLIRLTPLGKFFFGGDLIFPVGSNEKDPDNEKFSSYIIESNKFPQQTSLLGMMRYVLLRMHPEVFSTQEDRITAPDKASKLIGTKSFSVNEHHTLNDFGKLIALHPCFLIKEDTVFLPLPKDYDLKPDFTKNIALGVYNGCYIQVPEIRGYNPKDFRERRYVNSKTGDLISEDSIFQKDIRIGISKSFDGKSKDGDKGFYKQISYRLKDNFCFAFVAETNCVLSQDSSEIVSLGGDSSKFLLTASLLPDKDVSDLEYPQISSYKASGKTRVILLSDAFITKSDLVKSCFQITDTVSLRFLKTSIETKSYNVVGREVKRSCKYQLYERGSVFYFDCEHDAENFISYMEAKQEFKQIGYNVGLIYKTKKI